MNIPDGQITVIALANGYIIATRNIKGYNNCGLNLTAHRVPVCR